MQKIYSLTLVTGLALISLSSCDEINKRLAAKSIEGTYHQVGGDAKAEFTASKCIIVGNRSDKNPITMTFDYKLEGKHVFLETKSNVGGLGSMFMAMGNMQFDVIDSNTLKYTFSGMGSKTAIYKRVEN